jgi:hypothetical protein
VAYHVEPADLASHKGLFQFKTRDPEYCAVMTAKSMLEGGEFQRAAYATRACVGNVGMFVHYYSRFLAAEKGGRFQAEVTEDQKSK